MPLIIIFGMGSRKKDIGGGKFFCPRCMTQRDYKLKQATRYFTLFFIPIIPLGKIGEFVECQTCHAMFEPGVLSLKAPAAPPPSLSQLLNTAKTRLEHGTPVEYLIRDMTAAGLDRDIAQSTMNTLLKTERKTCHTCGLSYHPQTQACASCGKPLR